MTAILDAAWVVILVSVIVIALAAMEGMAHLWRMWMGEEPVPYRLSRRYWRRRFVRLVRRLAAIEAAWEQKKSPRMAAAKRGTVGERVRRSACMYSQIIAHPTLDVKGEFPLAVEWRWMRW